MKAKVQVKGTLPLIARFLNTTERMIYEIFDLNERCEPNEITNEKGGENNGIADKGKAIQSSKNCL